MTRKQLEKLYEVNGLTDYKLRNTEDLLRVHGIDFKEVAGYENLDDLNRAIYEKFIVNIFNAWGLDSRLNLLPKGIYFVEDTEYVVKEYPENDYYNLAGQTIYAIDRSGNKKLLCKWEDEEYKHLKKQHKSQSIICGLSTNMERMLRATQRKNGCTLSKKVGSGIDV